ncbi:uncharacterized protein LOC100368600 [Saccoglossus kowalevskii]|uniref:Uncharacterized protein LOC100368600 n=1 Tax=Saccoglossus kowalevskii TaxID=10224 RepID=A0ABM0GY36_SACKO|nr:PREDICTED: uncharacterized protein LOC100368600 [Saccoglossus kowalevskii]
MIWYSLSLKHLQCLLRLSTSLSQPSYRLGRILSTVTVQLPPNHAKNTRMLSASALECKILSEEYVKQTSEFIATSTMDTPIKRYLNVPFEVLLRYYGMLTRRAVQHGVSAIVIDTDLNIVVGAILVYVYSNETELVNDEVDDFPGLRTLKPNLTLMREMQKRMFKFKEMTGSSGSKGKICEMCYGGVLESYRQHGLALKLGLRSMMEAMGKGATMFFGYPTSLEGQTMMARLSYMFKEVDSIKYKEIEMKDGTKPFENFSYKFEDVKLMLATSDILRVLATSDRLRVPKGYI